MKKEQIARINELARKAKTEGLTQAGKGGAAHAAGSSTLADVRASLQDQLAHTTVIEPDGSRHPLLKKK